jgi:hypothetical protein
MLTHADFISRPDSEIDSLSIYSKPTEGMGQRSALSETTSENPCLETSLRFIDSQLEQLIPYVNLAVESQQPVIVIQMWQHIRPLAFLPFHLHLRWTDHVKNLPLTANIGLVPFGGEDWGNALARIYRVSDALQARAAARRTRAERKQANNFDIPDWEQGCLRHRGSIGEYLLSGTSFLCIDEIKLNGEQERGRRGLLGQLAIRNATRPFVLVPARGGVSEVSARKFAEVDLLIANIQGLRGQRIIQSVQFAIRERGYNRPTLIVASSPSDLLALGSKTLTKCAQVYVLGAAPVLTEVKVAEVGQDRALAERAFEFAVEELRGKLEDEYLLDLAKSAWWATHQSVDEERLEPEMQRFIKIMERLSQDKPEAAKLLTHGKEVLCGIAAKAELAQARRRTVTNAALHTGGSAGTLIIARSSGAARLRTEIASLLNVSATELQELGVHIQSHFSRPLGNKIDVTIVAGYSGLATIDAMLMSRALKLHLVFDPIEARAAWYGVQKIVSCLKELGVVDFISTLDKLANGIAAGIPPHLRSYASDVIVSPLSFDSATNADNDSAGGRSYWPMEPDEATIYLTDGTKLDVRLKTRFDVLAPIGGRLRTVAAQSLKPGDEIVLLHEDSRALFSEQLMQTLDQGVLKEAAAERELWLLIVKSVHENRRINLSAVTKRMAELGQPVNRKTVKSWIIFPDDSMASIPHNRSRFLAFAKAFGINMPEDELLKKFQSIKRWRIGHRIAGRHLVSRIRAAYLNRLDAVSQERLKREWGVEAFQLTQSARVATVDDVVLPREVEDAID